METIELKSHLQKMIDEQDDIKLLQEVYAILQENNLNPILKKEFTDRAMKAEVDIAAGRLFTKDEVVQRTNLIGR